MNCPACQLELHTYQQKTRRLSSAVMRPQLERRPVLLSWHYASRIQIVRKKWWNGEICDRLAVLNAAFLSSQHRSPPGASSPKPPAETRDMPCFQAYSSQAAESSWTTDISSEALPLCHSI